MDYLWGAIFCAAVLLARAGGHECERRCEENEPPRECLYDFTLQPFTTFSRSWCEGCPANSSACLQPHCVTAGGGASRVFLSVNRQLPGPVIQVCRGDTVSVRVRNRLPRGWEAALHWHGQPQQGSPHMDGVPMLTQCPIPAGAELTYTFLAQQPGTHFYHAHSVMQQADGLYGALVVHEPLPAPLPERVLLLAPWSEELRSGGYGAAHGDLLGSNPAPQAILINGRAPIHKGSEGSEERVQLVHMSAQAGERLLLRLVNAAALDCPLHVSIEGHELLLRAVAGSAIVPRLTKALHLSPGERYAAELEAGAPGSYVLRVRGLHVCEDTPPLEALFTVLPGEPSTGPPPTETPSNLPQDSALELVSSDCTLVAERSNSLCSAELQAAHVVEKELPLSASFQLPFGRAPVPVRGENEFRFVLHDVAYYPTFLDSAAGRGVRAPHLNHVTFRLPASPPLLHPEDEQALARTQCETFPAEGEWSPALRPVESCQPAPHYCECTHVLRVALNSSLLLTLTHHAPVEGDSAHTLHLHGLRFAVVRWRAAAEANWHEVTDPVLRDTVTVPRAGALVLRLLADNPGFWLLESRAGQVVSAGVGVAAILQVGDRTQLPPVPATFPRCSGLRPDDLIFDS